MDAKNVKAIVDEIMQGNAPTRSVSFAEQDSIWAFVRMQGMEYNFIMALRGIHNSMRTQGYVYIHTSDNLQVPFAWSEITMLKSSFVGYMCGYEVNRMGNIVSKPVLRTIHGDLHVSVACLGVTQHEMLLLRSFVIGEDLNSGDIHILKKVCLKLRIKIERQGDVTVFHQHTMYCIDENIIKMFPLLRNRSYCGYVDLTSYTMNGCGGLLESLSKSHDEWSMEDMYCIRDKAHLLGGHGTFVVESCRGKDVWKNNQLQLFDLP